MNIFDKERDEIKKRLDEIIVKEGADATDIKTTVVDGVYVVTPYGPEYKTLLRLLEILDNNLKQNGISEYIDKRRHTALPSLEPEKEKVFMNPINQRFKEQDEVKAAMRRIVATGRISGPKIERADDGEMIASDKIPEYNRLYKMKRILYSQMKTDDYFEYYRLRAESQFGPIDKDQYIAIMGRLPKSNEKFPDIGLDDEKDIEEAETAIQQVVPKEPEVTKASPEKIEIPSYETPRLDRNLYSQETSNYILDEMKKRQEKNPQETSTERNSTDAPQLETSSLAKRGPQDFVLNNKILYGNGSQDPFAGDEPIDIGHQEPNDKKKEEDNLDDLDGLVEVEKITPWKWVKKHKKAILIGLGIAALSVTAIIVINQLIPAYIASLAAESAAVEATATATKASQVAGLAGDMIKNGKLWSTVSQAQQINLHSANVNLANMISHLTGTANAFNGGTGAWTFGAETLTQFAASATSTAQTLSNAANAAITAAATAASKVSLLTNIANFGIIGGAASFGTGLLIPKEKSKEYHEIKKMIDAYVRDIPNMDNKAKTTRAQEISNRIIASDTIDNKERDILLRKLQKAIRKVKKPEKVEHMRAEKVDIKIDPTQNTEPEIIDVVFDEVGKSI